MLVNMGYTGGGPTPLCGVLRVARAGLQEDEAMVVDASAKRGLKRRLERLLKAEEDLEDEEIEEENDEEGLDNLCALGQAVVRELFACRAARTTRVGGRQKEVEDKTLVTYQRAQGAALKKINNKTARFARACEEVRDLGSGTVYVDESTLIVEVETRHGWCI
ncbi:Uncharacterized protein SCF082_LOCUS27702 [Durusdinium trenchii]|uniref:Uncharacterized protein n=1 Tax=Durusdinium trenchii TaxID=1381693 RepID=A0ABP0MF79_9DINO